MPTELDHGNEAFWRDYLTRGSGNVTLPASLLADVDRLAGPRGRSRYVAEAVAHGSGVTHSVPRSARPPEPWWVARAG